MARQPVAQLPLVFRVASQQGQRPVEIQVADRGRAADGECAAEGGRRGFRALQLPERQAEPVVEQHVVRVSAQCRPQVLDRRLEPFQCDERTAAGEGGVQVVRIARERGAVRADSGLEPAGGVEADGVLERPARIGRGWAATVAHRTQCGAVRQLRRAAVRVAFVTGPAWPRVPG